MSATVPVIKIRTQSKTTESEILTPEAMEFLRSMSREFESRRVRSAPPTKRKRSANTTRASFRGFLEKRNIFAGRIGLWLQFRTI